MTRRKINLQLAVLEVKRSINKENQMLREIHQKELQEAQTRTAYF